MQSASAVPLTPLQVAASLSPILSICSVPPGQVAETSVSFGVQISSHRDSQATSRSARSPAGAADPAAPSGPAGPAGPTPPAAPAGPAMPAGPGTPFSPCGPGGPADPCGPGGPAGPCGPAAPCGPSKHPDSETAATSTTAAAHARIGSPLPVTQ